MLGCALAPLPSCIGGARAQIQVNEKSPGKEQIKVKIDRLQAVVPIGAFGDPVGGATGYAVCLYDEKHARVATLEVNRPQDVCGTKPCWKVGGGSSYKYSDKLLAADGVLQLFLKAGELGQGKVIFKGKNKSSRGFTALPTGVAPLLMGNRSATVQVVSSDASCVTGVVTNVHDASGVLFKATNP